MTGHNIPFWPHIEKYINELQGKRLADIFRFISFIPGESYGPHSHLRMEINYVQKGHCQIQTEGKAFHFREGEIMIILPHVHHRFQAGTSGTTLMQLEFLPEIFMPLILSEPPDRIPQVLRIIDNIRINNIIRQIICELKEKEKFFDHLVVLLYAELNILLYRHIMDKHLLAGSNETLQKAVGFLQQNYAKDLNQEALAAHVGVSDRYLRRLFARHLGVSPVDYLNQIRIRHARDLLMNTDLTIKEVSFRCGFRSPQYFSRLFKQLTGTTPRTLNKDSK